MTRQMILDLPVRQARGRDDFFVSPANALALATLDAPAGWPAGRMLLTGPEGAGKSHLAAIWAEAQEAPVLAARDLTDADAPRLARVRAAVIEDAQQTAAAGAEEALFHLCNLMQAEGGRLLLTALAPPRDWGLRLPDLLSRMEATALVRIAAPDDALLSAVLVKLFNDRQTKVPHSLIPWLVTRMDRSLGTARRLVAALDARAVAEGRPLTRAMAAEVLDSFA
ncbi:P-loop NTPase family protein [Paenirhodobacter populi]|uniref:Chromosomal replication initiator DnaA n=1 Tax=Paenirhodobacter populi TaxID=2306993 RepID=A0A451GC71_9RHOB|nr:DnaA/Hda family protein [Sinirhodobacter populi]RWR12801.1 chromosomal replication initiator DnaA [Sinirhodobacter populi]